MFTEAVDLTAFSVLLYLALVALCEWTGRRHRVADAVRRSTSRG
jgi:hypothetical protein